jgi:hypothetical protein
MTEKTMQEKYKLLREPLTAEDIEVRVGTVSEKGASLLLYKTARTDSKRLDNVLNGRWKRRHYMDGKGNIVCEISIYDTELKEWISREDVGTESFTEKEKGSYSDSFKRAGSSWGIGVELYDSPFIFVQCETVDKKLKDKFYFNDAIVSKFEVNNGNVFVEIKKKNQVLFSNFNGYTSQKPVEKKQEPQKPVEVFNYEKLKEELMECGTLAEVQTVREKASNNKSKMSIEQQKEFVTLLTNTLNAIKEMENAK